MVFLGMWYPPTFESPIVLKVHIKIIFFIQIIYYVYYYIYSPSPFLFKGLGGLVQFVYANNSLSEKSEPPPNPDGHTLANAIVAETYIMAGVAAAIITSCRIMF